MNGRHFIKMHGLGNDFVVLDRRAGGRKLDSALARAVADRHQGVGCDQVIVIEPSETGVADAAMRIFNADGSEVAACGNATRCVATLLFREHNTDHVTIETGAGMLDAAAAPGGLVTVDMGPARTEWRDIPVAEALDTLHMGIAEGPLHDPVGVSMGNPHAVFFVDDVAAIPLDKVGPKLERHRLFPERANIGVAQVVSKTRLRLRVWERGTGITLACGTGACAAAVAASRRNLTGRKVEVVVDGGMLFIEWADDGHVLMTGPAATSFTGDLDPALMPE
ncbi:MAG: diaminopimelate epimerase [Candidatus Eiseniibacteriota bacterium]